MDLVEAVQKAVDLLGSKMVVVLGDGLLEIARARHTEMPDGAVLKYQLDNIPYRRGTDRNLIAPMSTEKDFAVEWMMAPEEYARFYAPDGKWLLIPVSRSL